MNYKEMKQAVVLLSKEWDLGKKASMASTDICGWIYLLGILEESEKIIKYKTDGKLIGFCTYSKNNSRRHIVSKKIYNFIKKYYIKVKV